MAERGWASDESRESEGGISQGARGLKSAALQGAERCEWLETSQREFRGQRSPKKLGRSEGGHPSGFLYLYI